MKEKRFRGIVALLVICVCALLSFFYFTRTHNETQEETIHYAAAVMEYAGSDTFRAYISDAGAIESYFANIVLSEKADDFPGGWIFRVTLTDSVSGIGTDTVRIPEDARTKVVLVGETVVQIGETAYQLPPDLDMVGTLEYRFQNTAEGVYGHFVNDAAHTQ